MDFLAFSKEQSLSLPQLPEPKPASPEGPTNRIVPFPTDVPSDHHSAHWIFYTKMVVDLRDRIFFSCLLRIKCHTGQGRVLSQAIKVDVGYCFFLAHHGADNCNVCKLSAISSDLESLEEGTLQ